MRQESQLFKQIAGNTVRVENTQTYVLNYDFTQLIFCHFRLAVGSARQRTSWTVKFVRSLFFCYYY